MEFIVYRTSDCESEIGQKQPCKEAYKKLFVVEGKERQFYCVEIKTLEELCEFEKLYGEIIITRLEELPCIEIYDYWRE